jgi:hypothetical protein
VKPIPLYRLRNAVEHLYTTSAAERDNAIAQYGYTDEGIACYVQPSADEDLTALRDAAAVAALAQLIRTMWIPQDQTSVEGAAEMAWRYADALMAHR